MAARPVTAAYRWCVLYVDVPDPAALVPLVAELLGPGDHLDVFRVPGFTVDVRRNPDRTRSPHQRHNQSPAACGFGSPARK